MRPSMLIYAAFATAALYGMANAQSTSVQSTEPPVSEHTTGQAPRAPVGHRQPTARDIPNERGSAVKSPDADDLDRKLRICRGC
jgi:hypothetical protein